MVDSNWKALVDLGHHVGRGTCSCCVFIVYCAVWRHVQRTLCVEKEDRGGEETSGFLCVVCFNPQ